MYYSLTWILRHLNAKIKLDSNFIDEINKILIKHVAEVDSIKKIELNENDFILCEVIEKQDEIIVQNKQSLKIFSLAFRPDISITDCVVLKKQSNGDFDWATIKDFGGIREIYLPRISSHNIEKNLFNDNEDFIINIDNKSIGHRPDLWCARGIARELSYFLDIPLIHEDNIFAQSQLIYKKNKKQKYDLERLSNDVLYAGISTIEISEQPSYLNYVIDLAKVDIKSHSLLVDLSNYTLIDIGHPMHVFDANTIEKKIIFDYAKNNLSLEIIDGSIITVKPSDIVISDEKKICCLGGIMGGRKTGAKNTTTNIIIESANYNPSVIRKTAFDLQLSSQSSKLSEKKLSNENGINALKRFIQLIIDNTLIQEFPEILINTTPQEKKIFEIEHLYIESIIGSKINPEKIITIFHGLSFEIGQFENSSGIIYRIQPPYYRTDITINEDIIREIVRVHGFDTITLTPPVLPAIPKKFQIHNNFNIKHLAASILNADEIVSYSIFNKDSEKLFENLQNNIHNPIELKVGYTQFQKNMITTLVPNITINIANSFNKKSTNYQKFEIGTVFYNENNTIIEKNVFSYCALDSKNNISQQLFFEKKNNIQMLLKALKINHLIQWKNYKNYKDNCLSSYCAKLIYKEKEVGFAGFIDQSIIDLQFNKNCCCFCFEIEESVLIENQQYFEDVYSIHDYYDYSLLIPENIDITSLIDEIHKKHTLIVHVALKDLFKKKEWNNKYSGTIRIYFKSKINLDNEINSIITLFKNYSIEIR
jgi:phenylalanyl-tRNA synthetase beta chain